MIVVAALIINALETERQIKPLIPIGYTGSTLYYVAGYRTVCMCHEDIFIQNVKARNEKK